MLFKPSSYLDSFPPVPVTGGSKRRSGITGIDKQLQSTVPITPTSLSYNLSLTENQRRNAFRKHQAERWQLGQFSSRVPRSTTTAANLNVVLQMPAIAYGTGTALRDQDVSNWVSQALDAGFSHIDAAQMYNNEESVGIGIRKSGMERRDLFVTTKYHLGDIREAIQTSLRKLGLDHVDLYLVHIPDAVKNDFGGAWREFEKIQEDGLVRSIGVSNFDVGHLEEIMKTAKIKPAVNQISLNPYNYASKKSLLEYAEQHGIVIQAFSILAPMTKFPGGPVDTPVNAAAKRLGVDPAQVLLLWAKAKGIGIVTTSMNKERLKDYIAIGDLPPLTEEEIEAIDEAGAKAPGPGVDAI
ncbi:hypothetical protein C0995_002220 [Termitomyces sp. Mi166|nr:hypothetical protein C0995_002220 [Termitomyces sp. Mi166\